MNPVGNEFPVTDARPGAQSIAGGASHGAVCSATVAVRVNVSTEPVNDKVKAALADRYEIERELGRGGMATVYLARDLRADRQVAIKVLNSDLSHTVNAERFRREIKLAGSLTHPNILTMYESGETDGSLYYVMPYVTGQSLAQRLLRERQLPVEEALRITCAVADALDFAHQRGFVHRDIKPGNILLEDGRVLVADFGIARAIDNTGDQRLTQTGVSTGTPTYMSPEQALADRNIDGRSDVYSLGCVLYEMLIGQPPFTGPTAQSIVARQMLDDIPSLTIVRGSIPDELEDAVLRALAKTPADRFATAGDFAEALKACQASGGRTLGRAERRARPRTGSRRAARRTNRAMVAAIAAVLIGASVGGVLWYRSTIAPAAPVGFPSDRIAVLYFDDRTPGGALRYVADGLTEALIDELRQVKNLDVISPNGVSPFRDVEATRDSIARALAAGTLVEGSIEDIGSNRLRIEVRLVDGNSGSELGSRASFEESKTNLFAIRDTLTSRVAVLVRERVGEEVKLREQRSGTRNVAAWSAVRRAETNKRAAADAWAAGDVVVMNQKYDGADSALAEAARLDASWPEPLIQRAVISGRRASRAEDKLGLARWTETGLQYAAQALAVDPRSAGALEARGMLRYQRYFGQIEIDPVKASALVRDAEGDLRAAVAIQPSRANAWYLLSHLSYMKLDIVEAKLAARRAYEEDAYLSSAPSIIWTLFHASYLVEQFSDAIQWCEVGHRRFPKDARFVECQLLLLASRAREPDVGTAWRLVSELEPLTPKALWELKRRRAQMFTAVVLARANLADSARRVIMASRGTPEIDAGGELVQLEAFVRVTLGERDEALRLLRQYMANNPEAREERGKIEYWWWRDLRQDPRYKALIGTS